MTPPQTDRGTMSETSVTKISGTESLDPITVFWEDFGPGKGQVTIYCFGQAWTSYWGGMGEDTIRSFFASAGNDYLVNKLGYAQFLKQSKQHEKYLSRICIAIKDELALPEGANQ